GQDLRPPGGVVRRARRRPAAGDGGHRGRPRRAPGDPRRRRPGPLRQAAGDPGSTPRRLPVADAQLDRVLYLRRVTDSDRIKDAFGSASRVAVIGAGWIGLETAVAGRAAGVEVTMLEEG